VRTPSSSRSREDDAEAAAPPVLSTVRQVAKEVGTLVTHLDGLRSENEALRAERQGVLALLGAIGSQLDRWTDAERTLPAMARQSARSRREAASARLRTAGQTPANAVRARRDRNEVGGLHLDRASRSVRVDGREMPLAPREFDLLSYLLDHRGQPLTNETILRAVWSSAFSGDPRTLRVHVNAIRAKLERFGPLPIQITTLHRIGYRLDHVDDAGGQE
jgi:hypothetical protein